MVYPINCVIMAKIFVSRKVPAPDNKKLDLGNMVYRTPQSFEHLLFEESLCPQTGEKVINYRNDIYLMFHQERLDRQTTEALFSKIQSYPSDDPVRQLSNRLSKQQLCQFVKSRYCQSMSELRTYAEQINNMLEAEFSGFKASLQNTEPDTSIRDVNPVNSSNNISSAAATSSSE